MELTTASTCRSGAAAELRSLRLPAGLTLLDCEASPAGGGILADQQGGQDGDVRRAAVAAAARPRLHAGRAARKSKSPQPCGATLICCTSAILKQWARELEERAPALKDRVVVYDGCDKKGDVHPGGATDDEIRRLAAADVVLATYDTLTRELASMNRTFDSHLERRQKLGLRTSNVGDEPRPSPLKFLSFWRVILDEVQKAPAGRKAGKVVRLLDAAHRWAVSGTPMDHGRADDLAQLSTR